MHSGYEEEENATCDSLHRLSSQWGGEKIVLSRSGENVTNMEHW